MIYCSKCGHEMPDDSLFCAKCGSKFKGNNPIETKKSTPRKKIVIYSVALFIVLVVSGIFIFKKENPIKKFESAINENDYSLAASTYDQKIKGNLEKEKKTEEYIKLELKTIQSEFKENKVDFQKAKLDLETINKVGILKSDVDETQIYITKLNESRTSFKKGNEFIANKNYKEGISEFKKVINEDENYSEAQKSIVSFSSEYKKSILEDADQLSVDKEYDKAISLLNDALLVFPSDADITAKKSIYEKLNVAKKETERKQKLAETKSQQEVTVVNAKIVIQDSEYKALYPDMIQVNIKNDTKKTVKNMLVSSLAFDKNGLPITIKTQYGSSDASFEFIGNAENVNIVPNGTFGDGKGWSLDQSHGISTVLSCVKEVEYYDGSKWENPYYDYWLEEYKEKPLK